jgi:hypothetical protein
LGTVSLSRRPDEADWPLEARGCKFWGKKEGQWDEYGQFVYFPSDNQKERGIYMIALEAGNYTFNTLFCENQKQWNDADWAYLKQFSLGIHDTVAVHPQEAMYVGNIHVNVYGTTNGNAHVEEIISNDLTKDTALLKQVYGDVDLHNVRVRLIQEDQLKAEGLYDEAIKDKK